MKVATLDAQIILDVGWAGYLGQRDEASRWEKKLTVGLPGQKRSESKRNAFSR